MPAPLLPPARPVSLTERAQRLREKMIATALLDLEDWSTPRPAYPERAEHDDEPGRTRSFAPPPIRWSASDPS